MPKEFYTLHPILFFHFARKVRYAHTKTSQRVSESPTPLLKTVTVLQFISKNKPKMNIDEAAVFAQQVQDLDLKTRTYRRVEEALKKIRDEALRFKHMYDRSDEFVRLHAAALDTAKRVILMCKNKIASLEMTIDQLKDQEEDRLEELLLESEAAQRNELREKDAEIAALNKKITLLNIKNNESSSIIQSIQGKNDMIKELILEKQEHRSKYIELEAENSDLKKALVAAQEAKINSDIEAAAQTSSLLAIKAEFTSLKDEVADLVVKVDDDTKSDSLVADLVAQNEKLTDTNMALKSEIIQLKTNRTPVPYANELVREGSEDLEARETIKRSKLQTQLQMFADELQILARISKSGESSIQSIYEDKLSLFRDTYEAELVKLEFEIAKLNKRCVELEGVIRNLLMREEENQRLLKLREEVIHLDEQLLTAYQSR